MFNRSGLRSVIDGYLGQRGRAKAAFTHGDVFTSMFGSYLCGGCYGKIQCPDSITWPSCARQDCLEGTTGAEMGADSVNWPVQMKKSCFLRN